MKSKKLTLKDVADMAGVSLTTASMYINGKAKKYNLADATCERIEKIIQENNFVPNFHARAIASKQTFLIGVQICDSLETSFFLRVMAGLEEELTANQYHILFSVSKFSIEKELESIRFMHSKGVDGLIILPVNYKGNNYEYLQKLSKELPIVTINEKVKEIPAAYNDNYLGGWLVAEELIKKGHQKIAFIGGDFYDRERGFAECLKKNNMKYSLFRDVKSFLKEVNNFSAVFCYSDFYVLELYNNLPALGIKIPDDLSIIGYDNMEFIKSLNPKPVTVKQEKKEMGINAAKMVLEKIKSSKNVSDKVFTPTLCEGQSVKNIYKK